MSKPISDCVLKAGCIVNSERPAHQCDVLERVCLLERKPILKSLDKVSILSPQITGILLSLRYIIINDGSDLFWVKSEQFCLNASTQPSSILSLSSGQNTTLYLQGYESRYLGHMMS